MEIQLTGSCLDENDTCCLPKDDWPDDLSVYVVEK